MGNRRIIAALCCLVAALTAAGCGRKDRKFTAALESDLISMDPHGQDDANTQSALFNIYDGLLRFDRDMKLVSALATGWENTDELTWRFHLRPGVRFHNGKPLTARDVIFSLKRARTGALDYYLQPLASVSAPNDRTVDIRTSRPCPTLINRLTFIPIVPDSSPDTITVPVGTGAYKYVSYQKGKPMELAANQRCWSGAPKIGQAAIVCIPDNRERLNALVDGRAQLVVNAPVKDVNKTYPRTKAEFVTRPGLVVAFIGVNFRNNTPMRNPKVRQAVYLAIDPREAADIAGNATPNDQLVTPFVIGYLPDAMPARPQPDQARRLLAAAGYAGGFPLVLEMAAVTYKSLGLIICKQLAQIGIAVTIKQYPWPEFSRRLEAQQSPCFLIGWSCSTGDAGDLLDACLHTRGPAGYGTSNWGGYSNRRLDSLIEQSGQILDPGQRTRLLQQIMQLALSDMPLIPIYTRNRCYGVSTAVRFTPRLDGKLRLTEIEWK